MADLLLYHIPGACSRVTLTALEQTGVPYRDVVVNFQDGEQKSERYLAMNPKGKVPVLCYDDVVLTENAAILFFLDEIYPDAGLLPPANTPLVRQKILADLLYCSSTLHPGTRHVRRPELMTTGNPEEVRAKGKESYAALMKQVEKRLSDGGDWWYGQTWSIIDVYIHWSYTTAAAGGFDLSSYPILTAHSEAIKNWPSYQRALEREKRRMGWDSNPR